VDRHQQVKRLKWNCSTRALGQMSRGREQIEPVLVIRAGRPLNGGLSMKLRTALPSHAGSAIGHRNELRPIRSVAAMCLQ
jgi:hypothetical protein